MSTASLLALGEGAQAFASFSASHQNSHNKVATATNTQFLIVDPLNIQDPAAREIFLIDHQRAHDAVNLVLNNAGPNLLDLDWDDPAAIKAWVELNWIDHSGWEQQLGISS